MMSRQMLRLLDSRSILERNCLGMNTDKQNVIRERVDITPPPSTSSADNNRQHVSSELLRHLGCLSRLWQPKMLRCFVSM